MAARGQELRASPMTCSSVAGSSWGGIGVLALEEKTARVISSAWAAASSLITAAGLRCTGSAAALRSSNCKRQRLSLTFDSHQVSSVPTSVRRAAHLPVTGGAPVLLLETVTSGRAAIGWL